MQTEEEAMLNLRQIAQRMHAEGKVRPPQDARPAPVIERPLEDVFAKIAELTDQRTEQFRARLAQEPAERDCRAHPGNVAVLNEEASHKATDPYWSRPEQIRIVYRCPLCVAATTVDRRARRIERAGIPADVRHATFENFDVQREGVKTEASHKTPAQFLTSARRFAERQTRNLILGGTPGIGKGHLAAAIAIQRLDAGERVVWTDCAALFRDYHAAYKTDATDDVIAQHAGCDLLILDEICLKELPSDGEEILFAILDRRHKTGLQTILLGNAIAEAVRKWLGGRIVDRLRSGGVSFCYGEWDSMRGGEKDGAEF